VNQGAVDIELRSGVTGIIGRLLVVDVAQALVEQQREDELLVLSGVDGAASQR
jgi:hypothetical protein